MNKDYIFIGCLGHYAFKSKSLSELYSLAFKDGLTKMYNRNLLEELRTKLNDDSFFVSMIDIDGLKKLNDSYGHDEGDKFIVKVSDYLKTISDGAFRLGGDEFLILTEHMPSIKFEHVSSGTVYKSFNESLSSAMKRADALMYETKNYKKENSL